MSVLLNKKIALLEDDILQAEVVQSALAADSIECHHFHSIMDLSTALKSEKFDLFLLDWQVEDGCAETILHLLRDMYNDKTPVLIISIHGDESIVSHALNIGADGFIRKPIRVKEFIARIRATLRRCYDRVLEDLGSIQIAHIELYEMENVVMVHGKPVALTRLERQLACYFCLHMNQTLTRKALMENIWQHSDSLQTRTIDAHVNQIRRKLQLNEHSELQIQSIRGEGYRCVLLDIHAEMRELCTQ